MAAFINSLVVKLLSVATATVICFIISPILTMFVIIAGWLLIGALHLYKYSISKTQEDINETNQGRR